MLAQELSPDNDNFSLYNYKELAGSLAGVNRYLRAGKTVVQRNKGRVEESNCVSLRFFAALALRTMFIAMIQQPHGS